MLVAGSATTLLLSTVGLALTGAIAAGVQPTPAPAPSQATPGRNLFATHCAQCHEASGAGRPPVFPALRGNDRLRDLDHVLRLVRRGRGAMPPSQLTPAEVAAVAAYVRGAWGNAYGAVDTARALAMIDTIDRTPAPTDVGTAWYTTEQASRGEKLYKELCGSCHGESFTPDDFSPGLTGAAFDWRWKERTVLDLFETTRTTMPPDAGGSLDPDTALDVVAFLLSANGFAAGTSPLSRDAPLERMKLARPAR